MTIIDKPNITGGQGGRPSQKHGAGVGIMAEQMMQEAADKAIPAGYKQTEVGVIPEDWIVEPLENFHIQDLKKTLHLKFLLRSCSVSIFAA
ncbi:MULTISPECIES: hypothetical protein, partial [unclassified Aeromonas]|uniref:hypothetical protein n=1 Tax=unclassified Aeromonas TaxID=257493 RepID=UPI0022E26392